MSLFKIFSSAVAGAAAGGTAATKFGMTLAKSVFKKTVSAARRTFDSQRVSKDVLVKSARYLDSDIALTSRHMRPLGQALRTSKERVSSFSKKSWNKTPTQVRKTIVGTKRVLSYTAGAGALAVGATGMMAVGIMHGMNNAAKDILLERYMQDQRYSRNILLQSRVGLAMGTSKMSRLGSTIGLSNSLSKTRHGARY